MRAHKGMRPQDIVVLLKIATLKDNKWQALDLSRALYISASEISESLNRSAIAGLYNNELKKVYSENLMEFIEHGLHYVFPQKAGAMENGIFTATSHSSIPANFKSELPHVWPDAHGKNRGLSIEPLYPNQVKAVKEDATLYKMLALIDIIRVGKVREWKYALGELKKIIYHAH